MQDDGKAIRRKTRAMAAPMPEVEPVINATRWVNAWGAA